MKIKAKILVLGIVFILAGESDLSLFFSRVYSESNWFERGCKPSSLTARRMRDARLRESVRRVFEPLEPGKLLELFGVARFEDLPIDADKIEVILSDKIKEPLNNLFSIIAKTTGADLDEKTLIHSIRVLTSLLQTFSAQYTQDSAGQKRLGRLSLFSGRQRVNANFDSIRGLLTVEDLKIFIVLALLHDIGKLEQVHLGRNNARHEELAYQFLRENHVLDILDLSQEEKELILLTIRYHTLFGYLSTGQISFTRIEGFLEEQATYKAIIAERVEGRVDEGKIKKLLRTIALATIFDIAGYEEEGLLTNTKVEYHLGMAELIIDILAGADWRIYNRGGRLKEELKSKIETKDKELLPVRITGLLSWMDINQDLYIENGAPNPDNYSIYWYWKRFMEQKDKLFKGGSTGRDLWRDFLDYFPETELRFFNYSFLVIAFAEPVSSVSGVAGGNISEESLSRARKVGQDYKINPDAIKYLSLLSRVARISSIKEIVFEDENGEALLIPAVNPVLHNSYMLTLLEALKIAEGIQEFDGRFRFVDNAGRLIDKSPVIVVEDNKLKVKLQRR